MRRNRKTKSVPLKIGHRGHKELRELREKKREKPSFSVFSALSVFSVAAVRGAVWNLRFGVWKFVSNFVLRISYFRRCQAGATAVEYALLLGAVGLPMLVVAKMLLDVLIGNYRMVTYWITLPFP